MFYFGLAYTTSDYHVVVVSFTFLTLSVPLNTMMMTSARMKCSKSDTTIVPSCLTTVKRLESRQSIKSFDDAF